MIAYVLSFHLAEQCNTYPWIPLCNCNVGANKILIFWLLSSLWSVMCVFGVSALIYLEDSCKNVWNSVAHVWPSAPTISLCSVPWPHWRSLQIPGAHLASYRLYVLFWVQVRCCTSWKPSLSYMCFHPLFDSSQFFRIFCAVIHSPVTQHLIPEEEMFVLLFLATVLTILHQFSCP